MLSSTSFTLIRLVGWSYVPEFAAHQVLNIIHRFLLFRSYPVPARGTLAWQNHYRYTFAVVVLGYLTYNLIEASRSTPLNLYEILAVSPSANENDLKYAFRSFARRNHPDRVGPQGEQLFITVRDAFEVLKNPVARFAYDRFGPDVMTWRDCATPKEYLRRGLMQASGFYVGSFAILLGMSAAMKPSPVAFWRYLLLCALFACELSLLLSYRLPGALVLTFPYRVPFQHVLFMHQLFVFSSVALTRVIPALFPNTVWTIQADDPRTYAPFIQRLMAVSSIAEREVSRMLQTEFHSLHSMHSTDALPKGPAASSFAHIPESTIQALVSEMENMVVEHNLQLQSPIKSLWKAAIDKRQKTYEGSQTPFRGDASRSREGLQALSNRRLPSPPGLISPVEHSNTPIDVCEDFNASRTLVGLSAEDCAGEGIVGGPGLPVETIKTYNTLPSPRPSPSPPPYATFSPAAS